MISELDNITLADLADIAEEVGCALFDSRHFHNDGEVDEAKIGALGYAALRARGWAGKEARFVVNWLCVTGLEDHGAARRRSKDVKSPWTVMAQHGGDYVPAFERMLRLSPHKFWTPALDDAPFDLDAEPLPPEFLIGNLAAVRGKVGALTGATHAFKSGLIWSALSASMNELPFLGEKIEPGLRWFIVEGENAKVDAQAGWQAHGIRDEHWLRIKYASRDMRVRLGEPEWDEWLRENVEAFKPDVLVLDGVARVCSGVRFNDNDGIIALFADVLVPLVDSHNLALVFTHHHRKSGGTLGTDDAVLGGMQWTGQADQTATTSTTTDRVTYTLREDGDFDTRRTFVLHLPKGRARRPGDPSAVHYEVTGVMREDGALLSREARLPKGEPTDTERLLATLDEKPLGRGAVAGALGMDDTGSAFRRVLKESLEAGLIAKNPDGLYERVES